MFRSRCQINGRPGVAVADVLASIYFLGGDTQTVNIPVNAPIGLYTFTVQWLNTTSNEKKAFLQSTKLAVIFNPYSSDDLVYMSGKSQLELWFLILD
jgi:hypothetical protein